MAAAMQSIRYLTGPPDAFFVHLTENLPLLEQMENDMTEFYQDPRNQHPLNRVAEVNTTEMFTLSRNDTN